MARLARSLALYAVTLLPFLAGLAWIDRRAANLTLRSSLYVLPPGVDTLLMGDSHAEMSLNPALIPGSVNLALSSEQVFFTYYKLRHMLDVNPGRVRTVVLAFSYHNIAPSMGYCFVDPPWSDSALDRYYSFLDREGKETVRACRNSLLFRLRRDYGLPLGAYRSLIELGRSSARRVDRSNVKGYGGFQAQQGTNLSDRAVALWVAKLYLRSNESRYPPYTALMIRSLERIADLCRDRRITLVLYNAPLHPRYRRLLPAAAVRRYDQAVRTITARYPDIEVVDMTRFRLRDELYLGGDHVNQAGADVVSRALARILLSARARERRG